MCLLLTMTAMDRAVICASVFAVLTEQLSVSILNSGANLLG